MDKKQNTFYRIIYNKGNGIQFEDFATRKEMLTNARYFAEDILHIRKFTGESNRYWYYFKRRNIPLFKML